MVNAMHTKKGTVDVSMAIDGSMAPVVIFSENPAHSEITAMKKYVADMLLCECYIRNIGLIDLRDNSYHGGTTLSSGALPKWDIEEVFIKVCSISPEGQWLMDSLHESYAMDLFTHSGVSVADAVPAYVVFFNTETRTEEVRLCEVAVRFTGDITYYRDLRRMRNYGSINDELVDFTIDFPKITIGLLNMFAVDYIMNQEDRHVKNFGVLANGCFAPLYDNGCSLHYDWADANLNFTQNGVARVKFLAKDPMDMIQQYYKWLGVKPCIDFGIILGNLDIIDIRYKGLMSGRRLDFNRKIVEGRVAKCKEILY